MQRTTDLPPGLTTATPVYMVNKGTSLGSPETADSRKVSTNRTAVLSKTPETASPCRDQPSYTISQRGGTRTALSSNDNSGVGFARKESRDAGGV